MAHMEVHAMSVRLSSTFEAEVFLPGIGLEAEKKYPVIWFIHPDGTGPVEIQKYTSVLEAAAEEKKVFIIAPDISHSLCTDMVWGTYNERFIAEECPQIFRNMYPLSEKPEDNYILGIESGAYGAIKTAAHFKERFTTAIAINGELDLAAKWEDPDGYMGFSHQTVSSLEALFGGKENLVGGREDLFSEKCDVPKALYLSCSRDAWQFSENERYLQKASQTSDTHMICSEDGTDYFGTARLLEKTLEEIF